MNILLVAGYMEEGTRASTDCAGGAPPLPVPSTGDAPVSASSLAAAAGSGSGDEAAEIQLVAAEGDVIGVPRHLAMQSGFLKSMIDGRVSFPLKAIYVGLVLM